MPFRVDVLNVRAQKEKITAFKVIGVSNEKSGGTYWFNTRLRVC